MQRLFSGNLEHEVYSIKAFLFLKYELTKKHFIFVCFYIEKPLGNATI